MRKAAIEFIQPQLNYILVEFSISFVNHYFIAFIKYIYVLLCLILLLLSYIHVINTSSGLNI